MAKTESRKLILHVWPRKDPGKVLACHFPTGRATTGSRIDNILSNQQTRMGHDETHEVAFHIAARFSVSCLGPVLASDWLAGDERGAPS